MTRRNRTRIYRLKRLFGLSWLLFFALFPGQLLATHLRAGEIHVEEVNGCNSKTYRIEIVVYLNSLSPILFGGVSAFLHFGDGTSVNVPDQVNPQIIDPVLHISKATFVVNHTYSLYGQYLISYSEENRNGEILNINTSILTRFHIETLITVEANHCMTSAIPLVPPIDRACTGVAFFHDASAIAGGDSVSYALTTPLAGIDQPVAYTIPNDQKFYAAVNYNEANENHNGVPTITIDPVTGILAWDAPGDVGEYGIAIKISTWRKDQTTRKWKQTGYTIRDMQILVQDCNNKRPILFGPDIICASPAHPVDFQITGTDPDQDSVIIQTYSETLLLSPNPATVNPSGSVVQPYALAEVHFTWNITCSNVRVAPYTVIFKISDRPPTGPPLVAFKNVYIQVIGDPPLLQSLTYNPAADHNTLKWKSYPCNQTKAIQVWRRVAKFEYDQPDCAFGMPSSLHYDLVASLPATATSFVDSDITLGPQYCYRVLALIGESNIPSRISLDTCIIPSPVRPPVITNVSILKTDAATGKIHVAWTSPVDIDPAQYPPPYAYDVMRHTSNSNISTKVQSLLTDTTFIDQSLNTYDSIYVYQIFLHVPALASSPIDTSAEASSLRLSKYPQLNRVGLRWSAVVPWSNFLQSFPYHYIFRGTSGLDGSFQLIDSVNVIDNDAYYFDSTGLVPGTRYYYKVLAAGGYGNPGLHQPLLNFSQVTDTPLGDTIPPCTPALALDQTDCTAFPCDHPLYYNSIRWNQCSDDAVYYDVYASNMPDSAFVRIARHLTTLSYIDENLSEKARCYRVIAEDEFGNQSDFTNTVCSVNCIAFKLPNVFTPGLRDGANDTFVPFGTIADSSCDCQSSACFRSVTSMSLSIYNRWGKLIFSGRSDNGTPIAWSGVDERGKESGPGIYYYSAHVAFRLSAWQKDEKDFNGWVNLIR